jgi:hypothetical protein
MSTMKRRWNEDYDDYDDSESDRVDEDINIDEYLSSDDTPDYKTQTNNSVMMMKIVNSTSSTC